jgi:hypothetical protein
MIRMTEIAATTETTKTYQVGEFIMNIMSTIAPSHKEPGLYNMRVTAVTSWPEIKFDFEAHTFASHAAAERFVADYTKTIAGRLRRAQGKGRKA